MTTVLKESKCFACGYVVEFKVKNDKTTYYPEYEYIRGDQQFQTFSASSYNDSSVEFCYCPKCGTMKQEDFLYTKSEVIK